MYSIQGIHTLKRFNQFIKGKLLAQYPSLSSDSAKMELLMEAMFRELILLKCKSEEGETTSSGRALRQAAIRTPASVLDPYTVTSVEKKSGTSW